MSSYGFHSSTSWPRGSALLWVLLAVACTPAPPPPSKEVVAAPDVARVNGETISAEELAHFLEAESLNASLPQERAQGLRKLIRQKVLAQEARRNGFSSTSDEARASGWLGEDEGEQGEDFSLRQARAYLVVQEFLQDRLDADDEISLSDLLTYYEHNMESYQIDDQYRVLEILVQDREEAEQIRKQLKPGDFRGFRELAKSVSIGVGADSGGDLGLFQRGQLPPRFEDLIFSLKVGQISEVFQSELGHHIFTVEEIIPRHAQKFYEVMQDIFEHLVAEQERQGLDQLVNKIMDSASIEIFDPVLSRDWSKTDAQLP